MSSKTSQNFFLAINLSTIPCNSTDGCSQQGKSLILVIASAPTASEF